MPIITFLRLNRYPLDTVESVQQLIGCEETLPVLQASCSKASDEDDDDYDAEDDQESDKMSDEDVESDDGTAEVGLVRLTPEQLVTLRARLTEEYPDCQPSTFCVFDAGHALHVSHAERMMRIGKDPTMPQHRPAFSPATAFPMWYFFYGTLAEPDILAKVLETDDTPLLEAASVQRYKLGEMRSYKVLEEIEDGEGEVVGRAFRVANEEDATKLAIYETGAYASVDVRIRLEDGECVGRTFVKA